MKFFIKCLTIDFKKSVEVIEFKRFTYFYGQIGSGKTTIAILIDYCLGGRIDPSPALQSEFISVKLNLVIEGVELSLRRDRHSDSIIAEWLQDQKVISLALPARKASGAVIADSEVEVLSDLLFYLAGLPIARVRKSKVNDSSPLERLSFRDLWNFCYLDQDEIDSNFFNLGSEAHFPKRNKARDVLRYILGYHEERVSELEAQLDQVRQKRDVLEESSVALKQALVEVGIGSVERLEEEVSSLCSKISDIKLAK